MILISDKFNCVVCVANRLNVNPTVEILDRTLPDDPFVCAVSGELFAYISLPTALNEDTDEGTIVTMCLSYW